MTKFAGERFNKIISLLLLGAAIGSLLRAAHSQSGPSYSFFFSAAIYGLYFIFVSGRKAKDALWSAISLPLGYVFFFKGAGASFPLSALLSAGLAALTLIFLAYVLYRG